MKCSGLEQNKHSKLLRLKFLETLFGTFLAQVDLESRLSLQLTTSPLELNEAKNDLLCGLLIDLPDFSDVRLRPRSDQ